MFNIEDTLLGMFSYFLDVDSAVASLFASMLLSTDTFFESYLICYFIGTGLRILIPLYSY
jgi:hypothetical protein